ncbi:MAG: WXG100 family type VII secretion target [Chloroflexota bacterium]
MMTAPPIIQAHYEELEDVARLLAEQAGRTQRTRQNILAPYQDLQGGSWVGTAADTFFNEMEDEIWPAVGRLTAALAEASTVTMQIIRILQEAEEEAAGPFRSDSLLDALLKAGGNFDWSTLLFQGGSTFLDFMNFFAGDRGFTHEALRSLGRWLNDFLNTRGYVGAMDDLYRSLAQSLPYQGAIDKLLKSDWFGKGLLVTDFAFGSLYDWNTGRYGDDLAKTLGVNAINTGIQGLVALNPYGAAALVINGVVQVGGTIQVGVQRTLADLIADGDMQAWLEADAGRVELAVQQMDLTNVSREIGEAFYESYFSGPPTLTQQLAWAAGPLGPVLASPAGRQNLWEAAEAAGGVVDGTFDWLVASTSSGFNLLAGSTTSLVDALPLPQGVQQSIGGLATSFIHGNQSLAGWAINWF